MSRTKQSLFKSFKTLSFLPLSSLSVVGLLACGATNSAQHSVFSTNSTQTKQASLSLKAAKPSQLAVEGLANKTLATKINATERLNSLGLAKTQTSWTLQSLAETVEEKSLEVDSSKIEPLLELEASFKSFNSGLNRLQSLTEELLLVQDQLEKVKILQQELDLAREKFIKAKDLLNQILLLQARLAKAQRLLGLARLNLANAYEHN